MALIGYKAEVARIEAAIAKLKAQLGKPSASGEAPNPPGKRTLSASARRRIAAAQKKRWAAIKKAQAQDERSRTQADWRRHPKAVGGSSQSSRKKGLKAPESEVERRRRSRRRRRRGLQAVVTLYPGWTLARGLKRTSLWAILLFACCAFAQDPFEIHVYEFETLKPLQFTLE